MLEHEIGVAAKNYDGEETDDSPQDSKTIYHPGKIYHGTPKILGGNEAWKGAYPWYSRPTIKDFKNWFGCGANLVSDQFVLTAAHCIYGYNFGTLSTDGYQIGALCSPYKPGANCGQKVEEIYIRRRFIHPYYNPYTVANDFTLLQLVRPSTIAPVKMDDGSVSNNYPNGMYGICYQV